MNRRRCYRTKQLAQHEQASVERTDGIRRNTYDPFSQQCISIDGGMVNFRGEGWKEFKIGLVSDFQQRWQTDTASIKLVNMSYTAVIGGVHLFSTAL